MYQGWIQGGEAARLSAAHRVHGSGGCKGWFWQLQRLSSLLSSCSEMTLWCAGFAKKKKRVTAVCLCEGMSFEWIITCNMFQTRE